MNYQLAALLLSAASSAIAAALKLRDNNAQSREWTPEQEAAFDAALADAKAGRPPHWAVEPDPS